MKTLSIESSTHFGGVALETPDTLLTVGPFPSRSASRELLAGVISLLKQASLAPSELDLLAVATGPGLFTGVRLGLSIAKTLAWSLGADSPALVGAPTLEAVAALAEASEGSCVLAATDARRGEIYAALFRREANGALRPLGEDVVIRPEALAEKLLAPHSAASAPLVVVGDAMARYQTELTAQLPSGSSWQPPVAGALASALGRCARRRLESEGACQPLSLRPHYVRRPDARPSRLELL